MAFKQIEKNLARNETLVPIAENLPIVLKANAKPVYRKIKNQFKATLGNIGSMSP